MTARWVERLGSKKTEVKRSVMSDMRRIGTLFTHFQMEVNRTSEESTVHVKDMISRDNFAALETAIQNASLSEDSQIKSGLKLSFYYLLKKLAKVIKIGYLMSKDDSSAAEVDKFVDVLSLHYNFLFGDAIYQINKNRETKLHRPAEMPLESDIEKVKDYTVSRMKALVEDEYLHWTKHEYIELRDLAASRLTLSSMHDVEGNQPD